MTFPCFVNRLSNSKLFNLNYNENQVLIHSMHSKATMYKIIFNSFLVKKKLIRDSDDNIFF